MLAESIDWREVRRELRARRTELLDRFVKNPGEVRLSIEIKMLDDAMLRCTEHLQGERDDQATTSPERVSDTARKS
jgi:hypothetical protein